ncbi:teichuronic acid exporter [Luteibacter sp. 621]|uniref:lipopolysaccharide biosynthesis protein n=1 Tax=Luteibacter sp. 621 TaxID=3373916 RepID=UPI003D21A313
MASRRSEIRQAALWGTAELVIRYVVQFGTTIALARLIAPDAFGLVAMVLVFTAFGSVLVDSGSGMALVQRQHTTPTEETTVFVGNLAIALVVSALLWVAAPAIATFYGRPELTSFVKWMSLIFPLNALAVVPDALLTQRMHFRIRTRVELASSVASSAVAIVIAARGGQAWALVAQAISSIAMRALALWFFSGWRPAARPSLHAARSLWSFGGVVLLLGVMDTLATRLQAVVIGKLFPARDLGYYTLAQNSQQAPASFVAAVLNRVGLPVLARVKEDRAVLGKALRDGLLTSTLLFMPAMVMLGVLARPAVELVYGPAWLPAAPLLAVLALSTILWPSHVLNLAAINAIGRPALNLRLEFMKKGVAILLLALAAPHGVMAVAWSTVVASVAAFGVNTWYAGGLFNLGMRRQGTDLLYSISAAIPAGIVAHVTASRFDTPLMACAVGAVSGVACYLACCVILRHPALTPLIALIKRK